MRSGPEHPELLHPPRSKGVPSWVPLPSRTLQVHAVLPGPSWGPALCSGPGVSSKPRACSTLCDSLGPGQAPAVNQEAPSPSSVAPGGGPGCPRLPGLCLSGSLSLKLYPSPSADREQPVGPGARVTSLGGPALAPMWVTRSLCALTFRAPGPSPLAGMVRGPSWPMPQPCTPAA